jgi:hypothetical protein
MLIKTTPIGRFRPFVTAVQNKDCWQSQGLIGWWPCGPTAREVNDSIVREVVGNRHAVIAGTTPVVPTRPSQMGLVPEITSGVPRFEFQTAGLSFPTSEGTIHYWTKLTTATPSGSSNAFGIQLLQANFGSHYPFSNGLVYIGEMSTARVFSGISPTADVTRTEWHSVSIVSAAGTNGYRWYVDGRLADTGTRSGWPSLAATGNLYGTPDGQILNGLACDFKVWNRALSDAEVWELNAPSTRWALYWQPVRSYVYIEAVVGGGGGSTFPALSVAI